MTAFRVSGFEFQVEPQIILVPLFNPKLETGNLCDFTSTGNLKLET
jgi:hypothetical protein